MLNFAYFAIVAGLAVFLGHLFIVAPMRKAYVLRDIANISSMPFYLVTPDLKEKWLLEDRIKTRRVSFAFFMGLLMIGGVITVYCG